MKCPDEILKKFDEFESAAKTCFPKVDFKLLYNFVHILKEDPYPMFSLQVHVEKGTDNEQFKEMIFKDLGVIPAFFNDDLGEHVVIEHRINFETLEYLSKKDNVVHINGERGGGGRASLGPRFERNEEDEIAKTVK